MVNLRGLFASLNSIKKTNDPRLEILIIQLYVEHFLNEIMKIKSGILPEEVIKENITIPVKTKTLQEWGIINSDHKKIIDALARTRNDLIHNLVVDFRKIERRLKSVNFEFIRDKNNKRIKIFSKLKPFHRLTSSSIFILAILYHKSSILKNKKPTENLKLEIIKNEKGWVPKISLIENIKIKKN